MKSVYPIILSQGEKFIVVYNQLVIKYMKIQKQLQSIKYLMLMI